jgi:hypothetical protein
MGDIRDHRSGAAASARGLSAPAKPAAPLESYESLGISVALTFRLNPRPRALTRPFSLSV